MMKTAIALVLAASLVSITSPAGAQAADAAAEVEARPRTTLDRWLDDELAAGGGLTADEVARRASTSSLEVSARRAELGAAAADLDRALAAYLPKTSLTARYTRLSDPGASDAGSIVAAPGAGPGPIPAGTVLVNVPLEFPALQNQYTFQASLTVPVSDYFTRISAQRASASHAHKAARSSLAATKRQIAADARIAYYAWVRARLSVVVAEEALGIASAHEQDANALFRAGTISKADVLRVESQVAESEQLLASAKNLARVADEQLRVAMHDDSTRAYRIGEDVRRSLASVGVSDERALWSRAVARRPETASIRHAMRARSHAADAERAGMLPRFDLFANAYYSNPGQRSFPQRDEFASSWDAGAQLSWTLSDIPGAAAAGRAGDARAAALDAQRRALADQIRIEVVRALADAKKADSAVATSARRVAAAEESYRVRRVAFQNGHATNVELLDAGTNLTQARFESVAARIEARVARVRLAYALGDELGRGRRSPSRR